MLMIAMRLCLALFLLGSAVEAALAQTPEVMEVSRFHDGKKVVLKPVIHWPTGNGPFGAVVVVNSSGGKGDAFLSATHPVMNKAGIAVVYLDTFTPRVISDTGRDQTQISSTEMAIDALNVADALRRHPRIKPEKIALQGQSKGAIAALHAATREWHAYSGNTLKPFDASVAFAPSCELQFREPELVSPLFAMLGEKDDFTLPGPCAKLFERMKAAKQNVTFEVVPGANHTWSTSGTFHDPTFYTLRKCAETPMFYTKSGFVNSRDGTLVKFQDIYRTCEARGSMVGGPRDKQTYILEKASAWLKQNGW